MGLFGIHTHTYTSRTKLKRLDLELTGYTRLPDFQEINSKGGILSNSSDAILDLGLIMS